MNEITAQQLRDALNYDPITGVFSWKTKRGRGCHVRDAGSVAGTKTRGGYWAIQLDGRYYYAHRLAWLHVHGHWPQAQIDHRDLDRANNALTNLRCATNAENKRNSRPHADNASGRKGIYLHVSGLWHATIMTEGTRQSLGYYRSPEAAHAAYTAAAIEQHGQFARAA
jgi:HNH endonuclease